MSFQTYSATSNPFDSSPQDENDLNQYATNFKSHNEGYSRNLPSFEDDSNVLIDFFLKSLVDDTANVDSAPAADTNIVKLSQSSGRNKRHK